MRESPLVTVKDLVELLNSGAGVQAESDQVGETTTFEDIGVDSLALLGTITSIERSRQISLPEEALQIESVGEFLDLVNSKLREVA